VEADPCDGLHAAMDRVAAEAAANGLTEGKPAELPERPDQVAVVFDTNVLVSAAFFAQSKPAVALRHAAEADVTPGSASTLAATTERPKFDRYASLDARRDFVGFLCATIHVVQIRRSVRICGIRRTTSSSMSLRTAEPSRS
jgi:hypothetical protein